MGNLIKFVCTLGPATSDYDAIASLIDAGMDFARLNFSHGSYEEHKGRMDKVRKLSAGGARRIRLIQDLPGPKIRLGNIDGKIVLKDGSEVKLVDHETKDGKFIPVIYDELLKSVSTDSVVLLCDGAVRLRVLEVRDGYVLCHVEIGGTLVSRKGVNITGISSKVTAITKSDMEHIRFGVRQKVDYIAVSFVNKPEDIMLAKSVIAKAGGDVPVIAKIEKEDALHNLDAIIKASDAVMVARGDLALEIGIENLALAQKLIISRCNKLRKPVITATQMLYSMVNSMTPTRAEVSDIANAIIDGSDALMLSEETTVGKYPSSAVAVLDRISNRVEMEPEIRERLVARRGKYYDRFLK